MTGTARAFARVAPLAALFLYLGVGTWHLRLPGLQYDEAFDPLVAVDLLAGREPDCVRTVALFGRRWPVMLGDYEGPTTIYASLLGLSVLGVSVEALRLTQLALGCLTLGLLWLLARRWFGPVVAGVATLLCATAPAFVFWSRSGANWMLPQLPIALGAALALERFRHGGARSAALLAAFLFGVGVTSKILFVWLAAPALLVALGLHRAGRLPRVPWLGAGTAMLAGLAPLIAHNLDGAPTWRRLRDNAAVTQLYGHDNSALLTNLAAQAGSFARMIGGSIAPIAAPDGWPIGAPLMLFAIALPAWTLVRSSGAWVDRPDGVARCFLVLLPLTVLPLSTVSPTHSGATYLFVIVPFTWLLVAVALRDAVVLSRRRVARAAVIALGAGLVAHQLTASVRIHRFFEQTGGRGLWSDVGSAVAERLEATGRPVVAMDWGFARNLAFLTQGRLRVDERFEYRQTPSPALAAVCDELLADPSRLYLFHVERHTAFRAARLALAEAARRHDLTLVPFAEFSERDGQPNTVVVEARPAR